MPITENQTPRKSIMDCFVQYIELLGVKYHVHDGIYTNDLIPDSKCTLANCSKSPNYQYEGSR